jgi:hypothetical protein
MASSHSPVQSHDLSIRERRRRNPAPWLAHGGGFQRTQPDIYSATCLAMFSPLRPPHCEMDPVTRTAFELRDAPTEAALDPILFEHRDMMYAKHLALPLQL